MARSSFDDLHGMPAALVPDFTESRSGPVERHGDPPIFPVASQAFFQDVVHTPWSGGPGPLDDPFLVEAFRGHLDGSPRDASRTASGSSGRDHDPHFPEDGREVSAKASKSSMWGFILRLSSPM
jgi:hypothetical protein